MTITRRHLAAAVLAAASVGPSAAGALAEASMTAGTDKPAASHDMSSLPASWFGKEQIAFLIYPEFTALDMVGPHHLLSGLIGSTVHIVAASAEPVRSDTGLVFTPSATFDTCPRDLDILCVPGGSSGTIAAMRDDSTLRFLKDRGARAKYVTSVCTGSLLLGAAGLLDGYDATSHWATTSLLPIFGARHRPGRVVMDRNRITGGGVTAGVDFGLILIDRLRDRTYAEASQLIAEYAPAPIYDAGTPERAPAHVIKLMTDMFVDFVKEAAEVGRTSFARSQKL